MVVSVYNSEIKRGASGAAAGDHHRVAYSQCRLVKIPAEALACAWDHQPRLSVVICFHRFL